MPATILIIDNTSPLIHTWKKGLESQYRVIEAMGGVEAVRKIKSEGIDLVIANISLRTLNGVEAIGKIRSSFDQIPVIVLHDQRDLLDLKQARAYNINAAVALPVDYKKLIIAINSLLSRTADSDPAMREESVAQRAAGTGRVSREADPADDNVEQRFYDGLSAISANHLPEAITIFESIIKATRLKRETWRHYLDDALFQLGQCYAAVGNLQKSNTCYKSFIAKAPHNSSFKSALLYLGKNYIALKDNAKAAVYLKQVINTPPFDSFGTQARKLLKTIEPTK
jgi:DNA-binding response OmpR family regulator